MLLDFFYDFQAPLNNKINIKIKKIIIDVTENIGLFIFIIIFPIMQIKMLAIEGLHMSFILQPHGAHSTPHLSLVRVVIMMLGEIDYIATFMEQYQGGLQSLHFPVISYILLIIFILLMPILLMNLLVGAIFFLV